MGVAGSVKVTGCVTGFEGAGVTGCVAAAGDAAGGGAASALVCAMYPSASIQLLKLVMAIAVLKNISPVLFSCSLRPKP
jgi:hypothetical protein